MILYPFDRFFLLLLLALCTEFFEFFECFQYLSQVNPFTLIYVCQLFVLHVQSTQNVKPVSQDEQLATNSRVLHLPDHFESERVRIFNVIIEIRFQFNPPHLLTHYVS